MPLAVKPLEIEIDYAALDPRIVEFKRLAKATSPPDGITGCDDCKKLDLLFALEQRMRLQDNRLIKENYSWDTMRRALKEQVSTRDSYLHKLLEDFEADGDGVFDSTGMVGSWQFPETAD